MLSTIPSVKRPDIPASSLRTTSQTAQSQQPSSISVKETSRIITKNSSDSLPSPPLDEAQGNVECGGMPSTGDATAKVNASMNKIEKLSRIDNSFHENIVKPARSPNNERSSFPATTSTTISSDMSRRKQRNPKPTFFASAEENDGKHNDKRKTSNIENEYLKSSDQSKKEVSNCRRKSDEKSDLKKDEGERMGAVISNTEETNSLSSSPVSTSSSTPPPHDLSSMVKVEVHEGTSEVRTSANSPPHALSPRERDKDIHSPPSQKQPQLLLHHSSASHPSTSSMPQLTPMPPQQRPVMMQQPPPIMQSGIIRETGTATASNALFPSPIHHSKIMISQAGGDMSRNLCMSKEEMNIAAKQNNMFHFGDVDVAHHPDTPPVPMVIPMVYLYPLPSITETDNHEVKYRMFVPLGGGPDGATMGPIFSPMMNPVPNPLLYPFPPELTGSMEAVVARNSQFTQENGSKSYSGISNRVKNHQNLSSDSKKESTTPLDLTKSPPTTEAASILCERRSLSPAASSSGSNNQNRDQHISGNYENEVNNPSQDSPISPTPTKNIRDTSPVTGQVNQRSSSSAALGNMIPPMIPMLQGGVPEGLSSTPGGILPPQQEAILKIQQKEFEAQLNFLKNKHLEFIKNQQQQIQRQPIPPQSQPSQASISRCDECNINFSKHQNYIAHKKYYCAANGNKANTPPAPMQIVSDNDDDELSVMSNSASHQQQLPPISPRISTSKKDSSPTLQASMHRSPATVPSKSIGQRTPSVSPSPSIGSNQSLPSGVSAAAMQAAAQAAINNILAMGGSSVPGTNGAEGLKSSATKEFLLLKQQQDLLNKEMLLSKEATLQALTAAAAASVNASNQDAISSTSTRPDSSSLSSQQKLLTSTAAPPPPLPATLASHSNASITTGLPLPHFVCEGCGIKFKSVSNLQAHQARYCAGLRKAVVSDDGGGLSGNPFETMIKRLATQHRQQGSGGQAALSVPPHPSHIMSGLQADMMSFLNAKSLEQQLHQVEVMQAAMAAAQLADKSEKEEANPPTASPAAMAAMAAAISAANNTASSSAQSSNGHSPSLETNENGKRTCINPSGNDDYCCILCGYKESSVERLKDHINMHFIGHVKRSHYPNSSSPDAILSSEAVNAERKSKSPQVSPNSAAESPLKHCSSSGGEHNLQFPPEPKRMKLEDGLGTHTNKSKSLSISPPINRKSSEPPRNSISPKIDGLNSASSSSPPHGQLKIFSGNSEINFPQINSANHGDAIGSGAVTSASNMRCTACDIGFSQMSNYLAHKKYYCRGVQCSSPASLEIKSISNTEIGKNGTIRKKDETDGRDDGRQSP